MKSADYTALLRKAASSQYGLRVAIAKPHTAHRIRRRLYHARDRARRQGDRSLDELSIVTRHLASEGRQSVELLVVRRYCLPGSQEDDGYEVEPLPLRREHVPPKILSRGPLRFAAVF